MATTTPPRATAQRAAVREALSGQNSFRSAQDVYAVLRESGHKIGLSTVYRHLQAFAEQGLVDVIHTADGEATYRFCGDAGDGHHHHLVCRRCGRAEEVEGPAVERWAAEIAQAHDFTEVEHTLEIFGVCRDCATGRGGNIGPIDRVS